MKNYILFICLTTALIVNAKPNNALTKKTIRFDGKFRSYLLVVPEQLETDGFPVLFALHGGGGTAKKMAKNSRFHLTGTAENWIVVYPQAVKHRFKSNWNDGRVHTQAGKESFAQVNDVKFILRIIEKLNDDYSINPKRIYATGISNGAYMVQKLVAEYAGKFAAFATVIGSMSEPVFTSFSPNDKVSVLMMNGSDDPIVPFKGGNTKFGKQNLGYSQPISKVISYWVENNQLNPIPNSEYLPDFDENDKCKIEKNLYSDKDTSFVVEQLIMHGGGHTSAGAKKHVFARLAGNTCYDIHASDYIVEFLNRYSK